MYKYITLLYPSIYNTLHYLVPVKEEQGGGGGEKEGHDGDLQRGSDHVLFSSE